jgi:nucleoid DNA-binding protein
LADFVAAITAHLKQGDRIRMSGLGILEVKARPARTGRNPGTGETIQIKASKKVGFRPAKELKEAIYATAVYHPVHSPRRAAGIGAVPARSGESLAGGDSRPTNSPTRDNGGYRA